MLLLAIVDCQSFSEFGGGSSYDVIEIGVIGWLSLEDFDADRAFLELIRGTVESLIDHVTQKRDGSFARTEGTVID